MNPEEFVERIRRERASAILRTDSQERAARAMEAAVRGGFRIIEFTLGTPGALELVHEFARHDGLVVGTGTVMDAEQARRSVEAGARFVVSPVVDPEVIAAAREMGVASMPGCHTPTEMALAHRAGANLCKLFPAPAGGPDWVRAVKGPMPWLRIVPTNGVDEHNVADWLAAGCHAVGFVGSLFTADDLHAGRWDAIEARARRCLAAAQGHAV